MLIKSEDILQIQMLGLFCCRVLLKHVAISQSWGLLEAVEARNYAKSSFSQ